jgi:hypothetical protein
MIFDLPSDKPDRTISVGWRIAAVIAISGILMSGIGAAFLREEARYALPEPAPEDFQDVALGTVVKHPSLAGNRKAVLLHFHSGKCPCSRYAIEHLAELARRFRHDIEFVSVTSDGQGDFPWATRKIQDSDASLAAAVGIYATPQAALLDENGKLLFHGSYNRSRFCSDVESQYVRVAIEDFLGGKSQRSQPGAAKAFGCALKKSGKRNAS